MNKRSLVFPPFSPGKGRVVCCLALLVLTNSAAAEVLQSISDDSVNVVIEPQPADQERHFDYRVICSPTDEVLDDCRDKSSTPPVGDNGKPTMVLPLPEYPPEAPEPDQKTPQAEKAHAAKTSKAASTGKSKSKAKTKRNEKTQAAGKNKVVSQRGKKPKAK